MVDISQTDRLDIEVPKPSDAFTTTEHAQELDKKASLVGISKGTIFEKQVLPNQARGYIAPVESKIVLNDKLPDAHSRTDPCGDAREGFTTRGKSLRRADR